MILAYVHASVRGGEGSRAFALKFSTHLLSVGLSPTHSLSIPCLQPFRASVHSHSNDTDKVAAPAGGSSVGGEDSSPSTAAGGGNVAWGATGLVMRVSRTLGVTGLVMRIIRALDSKLVVIDLVTVHHIYVHVGRLLRVLQGVFLHAHACCRLCSDVRGRLYPCCSVSVARFLLKN